MAESKMMGRERKREEKRQIDREKEEYKRDR